jgi:hypothetical protein
VVIARAVSKLRDPRSRDWGTFQLVSEKTGRIVHGHKTGFGLSLADVCELLGVPPT